MELLHREIGDKRWPVLRCDDGLAIGLVQIARQLRQELAVRDSGRSVQPGHFLDAGAYDRRDLGGELDILLVFSDVEIGLVEGERFDQVGMLGEYLVDLSRDSPVNVEPGLHEYQLGTTALCRDRGQGGPDAKRARLIACSRDDTSCCGPANGDGLASQLRIVALLD